MFSLSQFNELKCTETHVLKSILSITVSMKVDSKITRIHLSIVLLLQEFSIIVKSIIF